MQYYSEGVKSISPSCMEGNMWTLVRLLIFGICVAFSSTAQAQMPISAQNQAEILQLLNELPPETMKKVEALGKILQQDLKTGKLTESQLREDLKSGNLEQKLRLNPEAGPLLDDITDSMKNHPNADSLPDLLNGMMGAGQGK
jgi:hypothetical protein